MTVGVGLWLAGALPYLVADLIKPFGSFVKCEKLKKLSLNYGGGITKQREIMYANRCVVHQTFL